MRGLGPVSKERYDEQKERSNLVNIARNDLSNVLFSNKGNIFLPETRWKF